MLLAAAMLACAAGAAWAAPDLTIDKSHTGDFVAGVNGTYRLLVTNVGATSTLAPTTVRDTLPAGLSYVSGVGTGWIVSASGQVVTCTRVGLLAAGDTSGITLTVLPGGAAVPGVTNPAVVSVFGDANAANNRDTDPTTVRQVDLSISKSHVGNFTVGLAGDYSISVTNQGDASTFNSTTVVDTLPPGLTFVTGVGAGWSVSALGQVVTANHAGLIAPGASRSLTLTIQPDTTSAPNLVNRAHVVAGGDFIAANNTASDPTTVLGAPDLRIDKSHTGLFLILTNEDWTIDVENVGTGPTTGIITVRDTLPNNISYVSASGTGWSFSVSGKVVTGTRSTPIAPGETSTITLRVNVGLLALPSVTNSASVTTSGDGNAANNRDTDLTGVVLGVDLAMRKTHECKFTVGQNGVYTLTIVNLGSAPHIGPAVITDVLNARAHLHLGDRLRLVGRGTRAHRDGHVRGHDRARRQRGRHPHRGGGRARIAERHEHRRGGGCGRRRRDERPRCRRHRGDARGPRAHEVAHRRLHRRHERRLLTHGDERRHGSGERRGHRARHAAGRPHVRLRGRPGLECLSVGTVRDRDVRRPAPRRRKQHAVPHRGRGACRRARSDEPRDALE